MCAVANIIWKNLFESDLLLACMARHLAMIDEAGVAHGLKCSKAQHPVGAVLLCAMAVSSAPIIGISIEYEMILAVVSEFRTSQDWTLHSG